MTYILKIEIFVLIFIGVIPKIDIQKSNQDSQQILNIILKDLDDGCLLKRKYYESDDFQPKNVINHYYRVHNSSKNTAMFEFYYKNLIGVIKENELEEMKYRYKVWEKTNWDLSDISNKNIEITNSNNGKNICSNTLKITQPLLTADRKKAIISVSSSAFGSGLYILEKSSNKWLKIGYIPIGISN